MEDGLFTLMFVILLVVMSVVDAVGRRKQKQRRMEEMEREEGEIGRRPGPGRPPRSRAGDRPGAGRAERTPTASAPSGSGRADPPGRASSGDERETADQMIPDDFWAILTGEAPPRPEPESPRPVDARHEASGPHREAEPFGRREGPFGQRREPDAYREPFDRPEESDSRREADPYGRRGQESGAHREPDPYGRRGDPSPPTEPHIPVPVPGDRVSTRSDAPSRPGGSDPAQPTRRSARWMEGLEREGRRAAAADEAEIYGTMEEPWGELEDIAAGDLMEDRPERARPAAPAGRPQPPAGAAARAGRPRAYAGPLQSGDIEDLRRAVVLREVLGPPVGLRHEEEPRW